MQHFTRPLLYFRFTPSKSKAHASVRRIDSVHRKVNLSCSDCFAQTPRRASRLRYTVCLSCISSRFRQHVKHARAHLRDCVARRFRVLTVVIFLCRCCGSCRPVPSGCPVSPVAVAAAVCCCRCCCCYRLRCHLSLCCRLLCKHLRLHILYMLYSIHRSCVRAHPLSKPID